MDKKLLTAEEILEKTKELGYDVSLEDCEEAAEFMNNEPVLDENDFAELSDEALEDVVGGAINIKAITQWIMNQWAKRPAKSFGKIASWEKSIISLATKKFGLKGCAAATAFALLY